MLREAEKRWSGDHLILHVLWDNQETSDQVADTNIVLLPRDNDGIWTWKIAA